MRVRGAAEHPQGKHRRCRSNDQGERGASIIEYAALLVVAALLVGAVWFAIGHGQMEKKVKIAICQIFNLKIDCSTAGGGGDDNKPNYLPVYCDALIKSESQDLSAKFLWVDVGASFSLMWEKLANGEVWITIVPHDYRAGADIPIGTNVKGRFGGHISFGDTYQFQSDDDANKWVGTLRDNLNEHNPTTWRFWNPFDGNEADLPDPVISTQTYGLDESLEAKGQVPGKTLDLGGHISGKFSQEVIHENWHLWDPKKNRYWDNTSNTFKLTGQYDMGLSTSAKKPGGANYGAKVGTMGKWTAQIRYMYNLDGTLANIRWITTSEQGVKGGLHGGVNQTPGLDGKEKGGPKVGADGQTSKEVTNMTQLNFDDPNDIKDPVKKAQAQREQQIGHDYIHKYGGIPPVPVMNAITGDNNAVTQDPGLNGDPFSRLMYEKGKAWQWTSDNQTLTVGGGTPLSDMENAPALEMTSSWTTKATTNAKYLGAPQADGHRDYVNFPACEASKVPKQHDWRLDGY